MNEFVKETLLNEIATMEHYISRAQKDIDREQEYIDRSQELINHHTKNQEGWRDRIFAIQAFLEAYDD